MAFSSLRDFLDLLKTQGECKTISEPVATHLEMTEICTRLLQKNGPAVIFTQPITPHGSSAMPVVANLFGTTKRVAMGMGTSVEGLREIGRTLAFLKQPEPPGGFKEAIGMIPLLRKVMAMKPKIVSKAPCQEIVFTGNDIDLTSLPIQGCWPHEPAPLITWPLVVTKGKDDLTNLGIYRMQVTGKNTTLMRWLKHRGGAMHFDAWKKNHTAPFPVACVLGADPGTILAAVTPVPETLSEYQFAGLLREKPVELVPCKTVPLHVPATAEIILEGHVSLTREEDEGPYGDHTGYYNSKEPFPIFTVSAITMRQSPYYLSTFTGRPPDEPSVLGEALNEVFIPLLQQQFPEIVDFWLPPEGCSYRIAVVSIRKAFPGHAKRIMMGVWSFLKQFLYTKYVIIVDDDINCRDWKDVMWAISTRADPARDFTIMEHTPIDYLDFASPESGLGSKIGMDATNKLYPETKREWGVKLAMSDDIIELVTGKWERYGLD